MSLGGTQAQGAWQGRNKSLLAQMGLGAGREDRFGSPWPSLGLLTDWRAVLPSSWLASHPSASGLHHDGSYIGDQGSAPCTHHLTYCRTVLPCRGEATRGRARTKQRSPLPPLHPPSWLLVLTHTPTSHPGRPAGSLPHLTLSQAFTTSYLTYQPTSPAHLLPPCSLTDQTELKK